MAIAEVGLLALAKAGVWTGAAYSVMDASREQLEALLKESGDFSPQDLQKMSEPIHARMLHRYKQLINDKVTNGPNGHIDIPEWKELEILSKSLLPKAKILEVIQSCEKIENSEELEKLLDGYEHYRLNREFDDKAFFLERAEHGSS